MKNLLIADEESSERSPGIPLERYLNALRRQWFIVAITCILATGGTVYFLLLQTPQYVSHARMWLRGKLTVSDVAQYSEDFQNFYGTQIELMRGNELKERILQSLNKSRPELTRGTNEQEKFIFPEIRIRQTPKSSVFELAAYHQDGALAQAYLDALMVEFLAYKKEMRTLSSSNTLNSVVEHIYRQKQELIATQEQQVQFEATNNVALLQEEVRGGGTHLAQLNSQRSLLDLDLMLLDAAALEKTVVMGHDVNFLTNVLESTRALGLSTALPTMPVDYVSAQQQIQALKHQRELLSRYMRPKHPKVIKITEEINRGERIVEFYRNQSQEQLAVAKQAIKMRIESLEKTISELAERVGQANQRLSQLGRIQADIQRQQSVYDRLVNLLQGVDMHSSLDQENVAILERAGKPKLAGIPALPFLLGSLAAGLALGVGIVCLRVHFDDRCESLEHLRQAFSEEVFGQIPEIKAGKQKNCLPILENNDPRHVFAESCRSLRSSLLYGQEASQRPKMLLVTSAVPGEGKSTIALNLARVLALGGARVLLVDGDLRRGHLHELLGLPLAPGLAECVLRKEDYRNLVRSTSLDNLFVMPRGEPGMNLGEIFLTPAFDLLIQQVRAEYDYVIIDTVPVFAADDTMTLAPKSDGVIFVVRRAYTSARLAQEALDLLYQRNAKVLGLVFNRADSSSKAYRYYNYDGYYSHAGAA